MAAQKITKRWAYNILGVILAILIALEIAFSFGVQTFYYNSVRASLESQANIITTQIKSYSEDMPSSDFSAQVRNMVETFPHRDQMELMAIAPDKKVVFTSSGFSPASDASDYMPDYDDALRSATNLGYMKPTMIGGEKIMAVTVLSPVQDSQISAVRFVVSLEEVDQQIIQMIMVLTLICVAIIFFVMFTSYYFINSIVNPVGDVSITARRIAQGDFNARLKKKNDDEIGELCDSINYMAEELAASEKMKNDFISSVSHELRTPLTAIKGWSETLRDTPGDVDTEMLSKGMRVISNETERLTQMVEELLDFSRIQNNRMQLILEKMDLIAELSDTVLVFEERAKHENKLLIYEESEQIVPFTGDKNRLRQVFVNIIDNALKYSDPGDSVTVRTTIEAETITISISDTGLGIKEADLPKVKEKFFKANSTRRGSGIGLAVADEIVAMHGGSLTLDSTETVGTTVSITLPLDQS